MSATAPCPRCGRRVNLRWDNTFSDHKKPAVSKANKPQRSSWCNGSGKRYGTTVLPPSKRPDLGCDASVAT